MEGTFAYSAALQGRNVRLLKVMPDSKSRTLAIELVEKGLDGAEFEALSYVWGNQAEQKRIKCNGKWLNVGANLFAALQERRRRRSTALLWADQICISQSDSQEKTHQVRLMRDIYAKADQVIVWLGNQQPGDSDGFSLANKLFDKCGGKQYDPDVGAYDFHDFDFASAGVPNFRSDTSWNSLFRIIANSWFGRIWVVQELLVAQRSVMWKGSLEMNTIAMMRSAMMIGRHGNLYDRFNITMGGPKTSALMARNIAASYFQFKKLGPIPVYDMLSRFPGMGATDSRDRFFALAGVCAGLNKSFVNYEKSYVEVACLVGKMTLLGFPDYELTKDGTEVLSLQKDPSEHRFLIEWLAFHANPRNHELGLPSWVPDLLSAHSPGLLMTGFYNTLYLPNSGNVPNPQVRLIDSSCNTWKLTSNHWQIPVPKEIMIKGAIFDCVNIVPRDRPPLPSPSPGTTIGSVSTLTALEEVSKYETEMVYWLSEIRLLADPTLDSKGSIMDGSSFDAFWRTLIYNRGPRFDYKLPNLQADDSLAVSFGYWYLWKKLQMTRRWKDDVQNWALYGSLLKKLAAPFEEAEGRVQNARRFFKSKTGRIGWVPFRTMVGDRVCVLQGMRIPLILRCQGDRWEVIGACYVHGWMDGELWDLPDLRWEFLKFA